MNQPVVYIGMDLGTFKTSVVSSNGNREVIHSAVGWPKDDLARALLGRDVIIGDEVNEKRLSLDVVRPFHKGALKYAGSEAGDGETLQKHHEAAKLLIEHSVALTKPRADALIYGVIGAPSRASIYNKKFLMEMARETFDAVTIAPEPFAVAFGMHCLNNALIIDIGAGTIDMCPMCGKYPTEEDQITLPIGGDAIDEEFYDRLQRLYPEAELSLNMAREIKEKYGFVHQVNETVVVELDAGATTHHFDVTEPLKEACQVIVGPIVEGLQEVIGKIDPEFRKPILENIILAGGGSQLNGLNRLIEDALQSRGGCNVRKVGDFLFAGASGALRLAMSTPVEKWSDFQYREEQGQAAA
jgi:rod shape-determining protein MreB